MIRPRTSMLRDVSSLLDTPRGTDWRDDAACIGHDSDTFLLNEGESWASPLGKAKAAYAATICATCPVLAACRDDAIAASDSETFRGGLTPDGRKAWAKKASAGTAAPKKRRAYKPRRDGECTNGHDTRNPESRYPGGSCKKCTLNRARQVRRERAARNVESATTRRESA